MLSACSTVHNEEIPGELFPPVVVLVKLTDEMDEICINGKLWVQELSEWRLFAYLWVMLLYFSLESRLIPAVLEIGQVRLLWKFEYGGRDEYRQTCN